MKINSLFITEDATEDSLGIKLSSNKIGIIRVYNESMLVYNITEFDEDTEVFPVYLRNGFETGLV